MIRDFVYLIKSGPGSQDNEPSIHLPLDIRNLACKCLEYVIGSRDETSGGSIASRFSWLQHDLGVSRGQYMGVLPCLIRSITSFLIDQESGDSAHDHDEKHQGRIANVCDQPIREIRSARPRTTVQRGGARCSDE